MSASNSPQKRGNRIWVVLLVVSLVVILLAVGFFLWLFLDGSRQPDYSVYHSSQQTMEATTEPATAGTQSTQATTTEALVENPIDFESLQAQNADIYAWIYIPNTGIDLPIVQARAGDDDNFYLHKDINRQYDFKGMIYTQRANAKDFSDPVTVIYGHNMLDGSMFSNLHTFRDPDFFDENAYFYIYTPGHILTYEIVSAYQYDTRHILNSFDFSKQEVFQEYLDYLLNPKSMIADVRDGITLTTDDRIVTLSTCIERGAARYLVQGVLISDERTY